MVLLKSYYHLSIKNFKITYRLLHISKITQHTLTAFFTPISVSKQNQLFVPTYTRLFLGNYLNILNFFQIERCKLASYFKARVFAQPLSHLAFSSKKMPLQSFIKKFNNHTCAQNINDLVITFNNSRFNITFSLQSTNIIWSNISFLRCVYYYKTVEFYNNLNKLTKYNIPANPYHIFLNKKKTQKNINLSVFSIYNWKYLT